MVSFAGRLIAALIPHAYRGSARRLLRTLRFRLHTHIGRVPGLFLPVHRRLADYRGRVAGPTTELVIEGAPRVASTYCVYAFQRAQGRRVTLATHVHVAAHVLVAVERGVPTLVVIREPVSAIKSALLLSPDLSVKSVCERYFHFYAPLLPIQDQFVLADFQEVISDFGAVIRRVNERYGTAFLPYVRSEENERLVRWDLQRRDALLRRREVGSFAPHPVKELEKQAMQLTGGDRWVERCQRLYQRLSPHGR